MAVSPARTAAFAVLLRVERESAYAVELLHSALLDDLSPIDRNLTTDIVMGVLRWRSLLDASIAGFVPVALRKLDLEVLIALRMGCYQLGFLDRIPGHAIVHESVELVKQARKRSAAGLVNAVLRKLTRDRFGLVPSGKGLADVYAHPQWLIERWVQQFGFDTTEQICRYDQQIPATVLRLTSPRDEAELRESGVQLAAGALMKNARVVVHGDVISTELFRTGRVAIQDEGSQLIAALVGKGKRILDCCAAPGSKTSAMASASPEAEIVAVDIHPHRARLLRRMVASSNVRVITADAVKLPFASSFDRVLADVPCSGTGTLARNPEVKWRLQAEDIVDLHGRQVAILDAALKHVSKPGRLVYSTCSLEAEENEQVVKKCLQKNPEFRSVPVREELLRLKESAMLIWEDVDQLVNGNFLRTIPGIHPCDGFFAAVFEG
ncbi:MAG TPA: 16S rRNA (cytosine(967)-C(5))-methyltransferase RsmB [Candidatus Angelobacter sp.]|jgi:16S rRNA (cytosine967-C5)-methyltransferase|nr:16S rRNA (cytosine(967)-C(5))-methyltransferase RsmB [Candidatus Angelobacter sp.]